MHRGINYRISVKRVHKISARMDGYTVTVEQRRSWPTGHAAQWSKGQVVQCPSGTKTELKNRSRRISNKLYKNLC